MISNLITVAALGVAFRTWFKMSFYRDISEGRQTILLEERKQANTEKARFALLNGELERQRDFNFNENKRLTGELSQATASHDHVAGYLKSNENMINRMNQTIERKNVIIAEFLEENESLRKFAGQLAEQLKKKAKKASKGKQDVSRKKNRSKS